MRLAIGVMGASGGNLTEDARQKAYRARAWAMTGDAMGEDPLCAYHPARYRRPAPESAVLPPPAACAG